MAEKEKTVVRWQLDMPAERAKELDDLSVRYEFASRKDLVNTALSLFQWALDEVTNGRIVASLDESSGHYKQLEVPAFRIAAKQAKKLVMAH